MIHGTKTCKICGQVMTLLEVKVRPQASEWYCEKCHRSEPVPMLLEPTPDEDEDDEEEEDD